MWTMTPDSVAAHWVVDQDSSVTLNLCAGVKYGYFRPQGSTRMIHVSADQGETWDMAQLPIVGHEQFYSILAANNDMVFMHVDQAGGELNNYCSAKSIADMSKK